MKWRILALSEWRLGDFHVTVEPEFIAFQLQISLDSDSDYDRGGVINRLHRAHLLALP